MKAHRPSHPLRIATAAGLRGLDWAPVDQCRVLEIGCAEGGNLVLLAESYPDSGFVGIDLSQRQVDLANDRVRALELRNMEVHQLDLLELDDRFGQFDYVIAHGVYSWVPPEVRDKLLAVCGDRLTDRGLAYLSFNTYPGWQVDGVLRTMILDRVGSSGSLVTRIRGARQMAQEVVHDIDDSAPYGALLAECARRLIDADDGYIAHEFLELVNDPVPLHSFVSHATSHRLHYVDELVALSSATVGDIASMQYDDLLRGTGFRAAVLAARPTLSVDCIDPGHVLDYFVAAHVTPAGRVGLKDQSPASFTAFGGLTFSTSSPVVKTALAYLSSIWPSSCTVLELAALVTRSLSNAQPELATGEVAQPLLGDLVALHRVGGVELSIQPYAVYTIVSERPAVAATTRLQASLGTKVTNGRYDTYDLDEFPCFLVSCLDGSRTQSELVEHVLDCATRGEINITGDDGAPVRDRVLRDAIEETVPEVLNYFANLGLLVR